MVMVKVQLLQQKILVLFLLLIQINFSKRPNISFSIIDHNKFIQTPNKIVSNFKINCH